MFRISSVYVACALVTVASSAFAGSPIFLASNNLSLIRATNENDIETFFTGLEIRGSRGTPSGDVLAVVDVRDPVDPTVSALYSIGNAASGTPSLDELAILDQWYAAVTEIDDLFYGYTTNSRLYAIDVTDPQNPVETFIGNLGIGHIGGAAYDPNSDTLYMVSNETDSLYIVDPSDASTSLVGNFGVDSLTTGAEWYDGQLYVSMNNATADEFQVGTLDVSTGDYSSLLTLVEGAEDVSTSLAIVPEPATIVLLLATGGLCARRRPPRA